VTSFIQRFMEAVWYVKKPSKHVLTMRYCLSSITNARWLSSCSLSNSSAQRSKSERSMPSRRAWRLRIIGRSWRWSPTRTTWCGLKVHQRNKHLRLHAHSTLIHDDLSNVCTLFCSSLDATTGTNRTSAQDDVILANRFL
jgi:hypothetical protein